MNGKEIVDEWVADYDVFIESSRPGASEALVKAIDEAIRETRANWRSRRGFPKTTDTFVERIPRPKGEVLDPDA